MVQSWPVAVVLVAVVAAVSSSPLSGGSSSSTASAAAKPSNIYSSSNGGDQRYTQRRRAADWAGQRDADLRELLLPSYTQSGSLEGAVIPGVEASGALSEQDAPDYLSRYEDRSALPYREADYVDALNAAAASLSREPEVGPSGLVAPADGGDLTKRSSLLSIAGSRNIGEAGGLSKDISSSRNSGLTSSFGGGGFSSSSSGGGLSSLSSGRSIGGGFSSLTGGQGSGLSSLNGGQGSGRRVGGGVSSLTGSLSSGRSIGGLSSGRSSGLSSIGLGGGGLGNSPSRSLIGSTAGNWPRGRSLSLSIDASMKVLRQALLFKSAQLRQREQMSRARQNQEYLQTIGKRSVPSTLEDTDGERQ